MRPRTTDSAQSDTISYEDKVAVALNDLPAIGLPELIYTDGPNGIRGAIGATAFPSGLAIAAAFDPDLAERFGEALGRESLAAGRNGILGPGLDIARVPWAGRIAEALGEDPVLVGDIGAAIVIGIQSVGVLAVPKHFVANNFERLRTGRGSLERRTPAIDVRLSPRALREIYAEPFRRALLHGGAGAVLSSYNRIAGEYVSESAEVLSILRDEWGWEGFVTPDFLHAVRDDEQALRAGLDFPALGGTANRTEEMVRQVPERELDRIVAHARWALEGVGVPVAPATTEPLDDADSQQLAQEILERGTVLLSNDGILPLHAERIRTVALVGVEDADHLLVMGGSAAVTLTPSRIETVAAALARSSGLDISTVAGTLGDQPFPTWQVDARAEVRDHAGETVVGLDAFELYETSETAEREGSDWSARVEAVYTPTQSGPHVFSLTCTGEAELSVEGVSVVTAWREASPMVQGPEYPVQAEVHLTEGTPVAVSVEYQTGAAFRIPGVVVPGFKVGVLAPNTAITDAADAAARADVAVIVVGRVSGEAMDVDSLALPGDQERLIRSVAAANANTIVVTCGAGPITMPWADDVAAILHVWNPGERFGPGLARLLLGEAEPGGRLPLTFPTDEGHTPVSTPERYPGIDEVVDYSEDLLVGYRWYHGHGIRPLFPFGHGLGYTTHTITATTAHVTESDVIVDVHVANVGARGGRAVVQVYVTRPHAAQSPARTLIGFATRQVAEGETETLTIRLPHRDFATWDPDLGQYRVHGGSYRLEAGLSVTDIHSEATVELGARTFDSNAGENT
ncbi:glycoside hydrolase family 3 protein [Microbacterium hominis]|uniref:Glycoside hydrolase family 3 protein n=1 Tax=Microbacterium hominis TaxID=162426 RepID=A0A7D4PNS1_9MICO|nr:glycoside hydrolase family 3 C-terminal domain-containing protein [Microbacterium hominis]QKJ20515.1 glycoside hydrolase family 3 protein [Microbacterium hominis]